MSGIIDAISPCSGMANILALRNLARDRIRLAVTLVGIVFAVVLMNVEFGLFLGFIRSTSNLIDHAGADLWIMAPGTRNVDQSVAISDRVFYQALATSGAVNAAKVNVEYVYLKRPDGGTETVIVVGFDPERGLGGPWDVAEGDIRNLRFPGTIMVNDLYREKLGITHIGQTIEISGRRATVVGFTHGIRSFTQSPYIFASNETALQYAHIRADQTKYVLVSVAPRVDPNAVRSALTRGIPNVEVLTSGEFRRLTQFYWMFTTGAGMALLIAAAMGLAVGAVIVSQTLYATTVDHLAEFATLRAIGGSSRYIYGVIVRQAVISAFAGYSIGLLFIFTVMRAARYTATAILLPWWLVGIMFALTVIMCIGAALISIKKVTRLDPSAVFR